MTVLTIAEASVLTHAVSARSHLIQIVLDSLLVSWWRRRDADSSLLESVADSVLTTEHNHS